MSKVLIVDDEDLARLRIRKYLEKTHANLELDEATDGIEAIEKIKAFEPNVVFLDIEMPELTGFDVVHQLEERKFSLVFQTAYDEFALKAFEVNACDYILKPFTDERLEQALTKALGADSADSLGGLDKSLVQEEMFLERLVINVGQRSKVVEDDDVKYFLSEQHVTRVFLDDIDYAYNYSLTFLEERLNPKKFLRLHRNNIVNVSQIGSIDKGQRTVVKLKDGTELPVSRERKRNLRELFDF